SRSSQTVYASPAVSILADSGNLPIRRVALGSIVENHKLTRVHGAVIRAITTTLEGSGFEVVDPGTTTALATEGMGKRKARRQAVAAMSTEVLDRLRERTGADAVLEGNVVSRGPDAVRCDFQMTHTRTHEVFMT